MDKARAKKEYLQTRRPMGVYRIRNTRTAKTYVGYSTDLPARINRHKMELKFGSHKNADLLEGWKLFGQASFEFEILDELAPPEAAGADLLEELRLLREMWINKLKASGNIVVSLY
jgi:hypothetical protein